uniref:DDE Tnp4 domain-containing protein n=1 Tax=Lactuca sativa TaxID=4236 RepID=A0A9R1UK06_LACSA|nr:hypothetical protein LSAT_V11C900493210 [Lactuca sativa]
MFLHVLAHNEKNRIIVERFKRSGETVSIFQMRYVDYIKSSTRNLCRYPMTKPTRGGVGLRALDGTYIKVNVLAWKRKPYGTRKGEICTNVPGVCSRDLQFTYVLAGLTKYVESIVGTYYLCDAGYTSGDGFLTPYHRQCYHLNDWTRPPTNAKELYNMRYSSERNVIE